MPSPGTTAIRMLVTPPRYVIVLTAGTGAPSMRYLLPTIEAVLDIPADGGTGHAQGMPELARIAAGWARVAADASRHRATGRAPAGVVPRRARPVRAAGRRRPGTHGQRHRYRRIRVDRRAAPRGRRLGRHGRRRGPASAPAARGDPGPRRRARTGTACPVTRRRLGLRRHPWPRLRGRRALAAARRGHRGWARRPRTGATAPPGPAAPPARRGPAGDSRLPALPGTARTARPGLRRAAARFPANCQPVASRQSSTAPSVKS